MKKGVKVCDRSAQFRMAAVKNFHKIQEIDFMINQKWQKMPKNQENMTFLQSFPKIKGLDL